MIFDDIRILWYFKIRYDYHDSQCYTFTRCKEIEHNQKIMKWNPSLSRRYKQQSYITSSELFVVAYITNPVNTWVTVWQTVHSSNGLNSPRTSAEHNWANLRCIFTLPLLTPDPSVESGRSRQPCKVNGEKLMRENNAVRGDCYCCKLSSKGHA